MHDAADAILYRHGQRQCNAGSGDWVVRMSGLVAAYNWPDATDVTTARVITVRCED